MKKNDQLSVDLKTLSALTGLQTSQLRAVRGQLGKVHERTVKGQIRVNLLTWLPAWLAMKHEDPQIHQHKIRMYRAKADREVLELKKERRRLIAISDVQRLFQLLLRPLQDSHKRFCPACLDELGETINRLQSDFTEAFGPQAADGRTESVARSHQVPRPHPAGNGSTKKGKGKCLI